MGTYIYIYIYIYIGNIYIPINIYIYIYMCIQAMFLQMYFHILAVLTTQETKDSLDISCYIAGFTMNYPNIGHTWRVNGSDIASSSTAYNMTGRQEFMSIQKTNPGQWGFHY